MNGIIPKDLAPSPFDTRLPALLRANGVINQRFLSYALFAKLSSRFFKCTKSSEIAAGVTPGKRAA